MIIPLAVAVRKPNLVSRAQTDNRLRDGGAGKAEATPPDKLADEADGLAGRSRSFS